MSMKRLAVLSAVHASQLYAGNGTAANTSSTSGNGIGGREPGQGGGGGGGMSTPYGAGGGRAGRFESDLHGNVNILLGGAMLGGVIMVVVLVCYCCHRGMRKSRPQEYSQQQQQQQQQHQQYQHQQQHYWRPETTDVHGLEVFTMDSHAMCYERATGGILVGGLTLHPDDGPASLPLPARPLTPGPPPAYESLIFQPTTATTPTGPLSPSDKKPSAAVLLGHHHHHQHHHHRDCILPVPLGSMGGGCGDDDVSGGGDSLNDGSLKGQESQQRREDEGLPTYEAALRLEAEGYV